MSRQQISKAPLQRAPANKNTDWEAVTGREALPQAAILRFGNAFIFFLPCIMRICYTKKQVHGT